MFEGFKREHKREDVCIIPQGAKRGLEGPVTKGWGSPFRYSPANRLRSARSDVCSLL